MADTGPNIGQLAPEIDLLDGNGDRWMLSGARGKVVALFFYLADESPVCTKQMCSVRDNWSRYQQTGAEVVGVNTAAKLTTAAYAPAGDSVKDHRGWRRQRRYAGSRRVDGQVRWQDYPVTGDPRSDMRSYRKIDGHTLELTAKKAGNVVAGGFIVISADGTTRTVILMTSDPSGKQVPSIAVDNKQ